MLALALGPVGSSAYYLGFLHGESPCVLCWAQRTGMTLIALTAVFILRFGPRPRYVGLGVLIAGHGVYMAIRHSALHLARDVGQGFALEILGAHTYIWSAFIFFVGLATMGVLLLLTPDGAARGALREPGPLGRTAIVALLVAVAGNAVQAFASTGPPPFMGQSDPVRFSFDPRRWSWSLSEWEPAPISWRGRWDVERPGLAGLDSDSRSGPIAGLPTLPVKREQKLPPALPGDVTDLAYEPSSDSFLLTTSGHGVCVLDGGLSRIVRQARLDAGYSVELGELVGAAWVDASTLVVLGDNKSYAVLEPAEHADALKNHRFFLDGADRFDERSRGRFATVRARLNYVMALGYDPGRVSFYTLSVPNRRHRTLVVSRFDRADMTLGEEFLPRLSSTSGLELAGPQRSLDEYYVTGAAVADGRLFALSAAYSTLLVIDLSSRELVGAYAIEGLSRPAGLAIKGPLLYAATSDGRVLVLDRPF